jgi:DNA-binding SARP family transcriptional activator
LHANEVVPAERLIDVVWGERPPPTAATVVQVYVSRLRKLLGHELLVTSAPGYRLQVAPEQIDLRRAERLMAAAHETQEPARRSALLRDALALWRGPALADFAYEELGRAEAERIEELRLTTLEDAFDAELERGWHTELVAELEALLEEHPLRERVRAQLMLALYRAGRQADALSVYRDGHRRLTEELGLEPGPTLRQLERQILEHDPALDAQRAKEHSGTREERKVLSALFAEVIGLEEETGEAVDPEEAKRLLEPCFAWIGAELERFGGTVEKLLGDTVVGVFGAPAAHEDHAERAVRAALSVRDRLASDNGRRLGVRVGVSTGEALVRPGEAAFGAVFGRADRICSAAHANTVLVSETTYRATRDAIAYRRVDRASTWEALAAKTAIRTERAHAREVALVGRAEELAVVSERVRRAAKTRAPQLVTIVGAPGIGKTRLVREVAEQLPPALTVWLQGRSIAYGDGVAYSAFAEAVKAYAGILDTDAPNEAGDKLRAAAARAVPDEPDAVENQLRVLLGLEAGEAGTERAAAFAAWRQFLEGIATKRPLALALEDIHWADEGLLDFVEHVAGSSEDAPLVLLCTARPELLERRPDWAENASHATIVDLRPLTDEEMRTLVGALLEDGTLAMELEEMIVSRVGGNPLFAEEYVRAVADRGVSKEEPLPESVHNIIAARLDGLPPDAKALLQDAAVIGKVFWPGSVAALGGRSRLGSEAQLDQLVHGDFIRLDDRSAMQDEAQYAFKHVLIRDVAYSQIPRPERSAKHRRAAQWIESHARADDVAELMAHHYVTAFELARASGIEAPDLTERSVEALWRAGERARQLYANDDAARYFRQALALLEQATEAEPEWRGELSLAAHESLGDVLELTGNHVEGDASLATALELASGEDRVRRARLLRKQGVSRQLQRRLDDARDAFTAADTALGDKPLSAAWWQERCEIAIQRLQLLYFGGRRARLGEHQHDRLHALRVRLLPAVGRGARRGGDANAREPYAQRTPRRRDDGRPLPQLPRRDREKAWPGRGGTGAREPHPRVGGADPDARVRLPGACDALVDCMARRRP